MTAFAMPGDESERRNLRDRLADVIFDAIDDGVRSRAGHPPRHEWADAEHAANRVLEVLDRS